MSICEEWKERGFKDTVWDKLAEMDDKLIELGKTIENKDYPKWLGNEAFHASHRSNLLRKDSIHYGQFGWTEPHNLPYVWPV